MRNSMTAFTLNNGILTTASGKEAKNAYISAQEPP